MKICPACAREYADAEPRCREDGAALVQLDTSSNERASDLIGQVVDGRYRIDRIVGRGGMGTVYAARHVVVGKQMAIKVLRSGIERSEEILQRFIREAQAANAVRSRHICEMTDFGQLPTGAFYVVMELLDGISLTRALREGRLSRRQIKKVFIQIAETLDKAHRANIVHRDLKPDNVVLVEDDGDPFFVKLVDFGIAKVMESKASNLTETGVILGTPYYMSPEQARGDEVDHRSDIYALGVMMYRAFTGKLPFVADTAMGVLTRHLTQKPELPSRVVAGIDRSVERIILRCLEKKPIDRFQAMSHVAEALRSIPDKARKQRRDTATIDERNQPHWTGATRASTTHVASDRHSARTDTATTPQPAPTAAIASPAAGVPAARGSAPGAPAPRASGPGVPVARGSAPGAPAPRASGPGAPMSQSSGSLVFPPVMPLPMAPASQNGPTGAPMSPHEAAAMGYPQPAWASNNAPAAGHAQPVGHAQPAAHAQAAGQPQLAARTQPGHPQQPARAAAQPPGYGANALRSGPYPAQADASGQVPALAGAPLGSHGLTGPGRGGASPSSPPPPPQGTAPGAYQPEAYTNRGVVSSRLEIPQPQPTPKTDIWVGVGGALLVAMLFGGVLFVILGDNNDAPAPAATTAASATPPPTEPSADSSSDDDPAPAPNASGSAEPNAAAPNAAAPDASASSSSSASATPSTALPTPRPPQPMLQPRPIRPQPPRPVRPQPPPSQPSPSPPPFQDIRSPFD